MRLVESAQFAWRMVGFVELDRYVLTTRQVQPSMLCLKYAQETLAQEA